MQDSHEAVAEYVIGNMAELLDMCHDSNGGCAHCRYRNSCVRWWDGLVLSYDSSNFHRNGHKPLFDVELSKAYVSWRAVARGRLLSSPV